MSKITQAKKLRRLQSQLVVQSNGGKLKIVGKHFPKKGGVGWSPERWEFSIGARHLIDADRWEEGNASTVKRILTVLEEIGMIELEVENREQWDAVYVNDID